jgi:hypothetical protein
MRTALPACGLRFDVRTVRIEDDRGGAGGTRGTKIRLGSSSHARLVALSRSSYCAPLVRCIPFSRRGGQACRVHRCGHLPVRIRAGRFLGRGHPAVVGRAPPAGAGSSHEARSGPENRKRPGGRKKNRTVPKHPLPDAGYSRCDVASAEVLPPKPDSPSRECRVEGEPAFRAWPPRDRYRSVTIVARGITPPSLRARPTPDT